MHILPWRGRNGTDFAFGFRIAGWPDHLPDRWPFSHLVVGDRRADQARVPRAQAHRLRPQGLGMD